MKKYMLFLFLLLLFFIIHLCTIEYLEEKAPYRLLVPHIPFRTVPTGPWKHLDNPQFSKQSINLWNKNYNNVM